jgi:membrane protease YdiL (CAAX protease family)
MSDSAQHVLVAVACVIIAASLLLWVMAIDRLVRGRPLLEVQPRRAVPWTLIDLLIIGLVGIAIVVLSQWMCVRRFDLPEDRWRLEDLAPEQQIGVLATFSAASLASWLAALVVARWRSGATWADLGLDASQRWRDVALGMAAFAMLIVPVLSIHLLTQLIFPTDETHPFIDLVMDDPRPEYLLPIAFAALISAPLVEEYFFRVFLQGWLERLSARLTRPAVTLSDGDLVNGLDRVAAAGSAGEALSEGEPEPCDHDGNPYTAPAAAELVPATAPAAPLIEPGLPERPRWRWLVIAISALAFALAHFGQGTAPISLFVLALGLGYLYQRTHRVLPSIVVHFLVNLTAVVQLGLEILNRQSS